ncbi:hypothetical protein FACS1894162_6020 [Bacteroidia bacterium]|nr:hypothetical protein FACS1894162_6020 [Bacteroidia bacterium]
MNKQFNSSLNPVQLHLLQMFSFDQQQESLVELKSILFDFYRKKVETEASFLWDKKGLDNTQIEKILHSQENTIS